MDLSCLHPTVSAVQDGHCAVPLSLDLLPVVDPAHPGPWFTLQHVLHRKSAVHIVVPELPGWTVPYHSAGHPPHLQLLPQHEEQHSYGSQVPTAYLCHCRADTDFGVCGSVWSSFGSLGGEVRERDLSDKKC